MLGRLRRILLSPLRCAFSFSFSLSLPRFLSSLSISLGPPFPPHGPFVGITALCAPVILRFPPLSPDNSAKSSFSISPENVWENTSGDLFIASHTDARLNWLLLTLYDMCKRLSSTLDFLINEKNVKKTYVKIEKRCIY